MAKNVDYSEIWVEEHNEHLQKLKMIRQERSGSSKVIREISKENSFRFNLLALQKWDFIK